MTEIFAQKTVIIYTTIIIITIQEVREEASHFSQQPVSCLFLLFCKKFLSYIVLLIRFLLQWTVVNL